MDGGIKVQSEVGVGSTFTVSLPLTKPRSAPGAQPPAPASAVTGGLRVLAAEDNPTNELVLQTLLGAMGIDPVVVSNGEEAVQVWKDGRWDVVLMDIQMPVMDGVSATRAIREIERSEGFARTAIIAVTANAMTHHREEYLAAGMDEVVPKPINVATLIEAMNQASKRGDLPPASAAPDLALAAGALSVA